MNFIFILTDEPYNDNVCYYGAYTTEEKAREAMASFNADPANGWGPTRIVRMPVDQPAALVK